MQDEKQESIAASPEKKERSGAVRSAETARVLVRHAKRAARRKFAAEEKVRIVMEGIRGELVRLQTAGLETIRQGGSVTFELMHEHLGGLSGEQIHPIILSPDFLYELFAATLC
jgi:hypothetical protein